MVDACFVQRKCHFLVSAFQMKISPTHTVGSFLNAYGPLLFIYSTTIQYTNPQMLANTKTDVRNRENTF